MMNRLAWRGEFTGWHMLAVTLLFFGTIIAVNVTLAVYASRSWTGLVVRNSYVASQQFNEVTAEKRREAQLGFTADFTASRDQLRLAVTGPQGRAVTGATATVRLGRPSHEGEDRDFALIEIGNGIYEANTDLALGVWSGEARLVTALGDVWTQPLRIWIREDRK
jgi:nitrogen fixation protein FixH